MQKRCGFTDKFSLGYGELPIIPSVGSGAGAVALLALEPEAFVPPVSRSAVPPQCSWSGLLRFQPPPPRTVHAVLSHTAHRRRSPPAFGLARQSRKGLGSTTIPDKVTSPSWFGDW